MANNYPFLLLSICALHLLIGSNNVNGVPEPEDAGESDVAEENVTVFANQTISTDEQLASSDIVDGSEDDAADGSDREDEGGGTATVVSDITDDDDDEYYLTVCPSDADCDVLGAECLDCSFNYSCVYGLNTSVSCTVKPDITCNGDTVMLKTFTCRYCYQTPHWEHYCPGISTCKVGTSPISYYRSNCTVKGEVMCLGHRTFYKRKACNWTSGYRWSTTMVLSVTLGGFGVDRFYLGYWKEGLGKLFSFGGLGVWTIVDCLLIGVGYIRPADGSLYIF